MDSSGYPRRLQGEQIGVYAQVIGLSDVYEAMTHRRPYRPAFIPYEAMKTILQDRPRFDREVVKALIRRIGIFPAGSAVRLNTKEIAVVTAHNPRSPLRPVVNIIFDAQGRRQEGPKRLDLAQNFVIYIEDSVRQSGEQTAQE